MNRKFLGICIVIAALLLSCAIALDTIVKLLADSSDRYSFYVDTSRRIVYTFDKYTGMYSKRDTKDFDRGMWNDIR
jgi:hypothetical protein